MIHSSFLKLLSALSKKEVFSFYEFSQVVHAQQKVCNRLLSYILSHGTNEKDWKEISIEDAYLATFNQTYSSEKHRKKIFNTLADLDTRLNNYLIWKEVQQSTMIRQLILSRIYLKRGLTNRFDKTIRSAINKMESISNGFWQPLFLEMFYHLSYFSSTTIPVTKFSKLEAAMKYLEQFYLQAKLRYVGEMVNRKNLLGDNSNFTVPTDLLYNVGKLEHQDNDYMQLYYWIVQLSKNRSESAYKKVKHYFNLVPFTDKEEEQEVLTHLLNFCNYKIKEGKQSYARESLDLQKEAIEANKLGPYFLGTRFFNIVSLSCGLKDTEWAEYFINKFAGKVNTPDKGDFLSLSKVRVFIEREQYEQALVSLINVKSKLFQIEMLRRTFQIKCLVELKENPVLIRNYCSNFLLYLKRDKLSSKEVKLAYINYIKVVKKLQNRVSKQHIVTFIGSTHLMMYKNWVLEWIDSYNK